MFDIGFFELLLIFSLGLLVIGPQKLPEVVRQVVARVRRFRAWMSDFQNDVEQHLDVRSLEQDLHNNSVMRKIERARQAGVDINSEMHEQLGVPASQPPENKDEKDSAKDRPKDP